MPTFPLPSRTATFAERILLTCVPYHSYQTNLMSNDHLLIAMEAAQRGGAELLRWRGEFTAREKGPRDLVTEADLASQKAIEVFLCESFPDHEFLGEEDPDLSLLETAETLWVVDPLDGTTNYVHGMNAFAVSVALVSRGQPVVGVIYDPVTEEFFFASRGEGAWLKHGSSTTRLQVSDIQAMDQALIAASFPTTVTPGSAEELRFLHVLRASQAVRRIGAAALNLAYVAAGRMDGYWATNVKAWDVAAGFLLVEEAGAKLTHLDGSTACLVDPRFATAATESLFRSFKEILDERF